MGNEHFIMRKQTLFNKDNVSSLIVRHKEKIENEIEKLNEEYLLTVNLDEVIQYFVDTYFFNVPTLQNNSIEIAQDDNNQHLLVKIYVPFEGDPKLFNVSPSSKSNIHIDHTIEVTEREVIIIINIDGRIITNDTLRVKEIIDKIINNIDKNLSSLRTDLEPHNQTLQGNIHKRLIDLKNEFESKNKFISSLGFPLRKRENTPLTYVVPTIRKKVLSTLPVNSSVTKLDPVIELSEYENILNIINNMVMVMEKSPNAFKNMNEEDLRYHFLVQLNGQYEGQATGETFNFEGKTDILVRYEGKNIFIAECKFWDGPIKLTQTIEQLLQYTSWRDTKTAIIIFNRTKSLSAVLKKISPTIENHQNYIRTLDSKSETTFKYIFRHRDDPERELYLSVLVFEVPA